MEIIVVIIVIILVILACVILGLMGWVLKAFGWVFDFLKEGCSTSFGCLFWTVLILLFLMALVL